MQEAELKQRKTRRTDTSAEPLEPTEDSITGSDTRVSGKVMQNIMNGVSDLIADDDFVAMLRTLTRPQP
jgi:hypothetical protein